MGTRTECKYVTRNADNADSGACKCALGTKTGLLYSGLVFDNENSY